MCRWMGSGDWSQREASWESRLTRHRVGSVRSAGDAGQGPATIWGPGCGNSGSQCWGEHREPKERTVKTPR